jgi:hypothetical protein
MTLVFVLMLGCWFRIEIASMKSWSWPALITVWVEATRRIGVKVAWITSVVLLSVGRSDEISLRVGSEQVPSVKLGNTTVGDPIPEVCESNLGGCLRWVV